MVACKGLQVGEGLTVDGEGGGTGSHGEAAGAGGDAGVLSGVLVRVHSAEDERGADLEAAGGVDQRLAVAVPRVGESGCRIRLALQTGLAACDRGHVRRLAVEVERVSLAGYH